MRPPEQVRYPGDIPDPTRGEAEEALALARSVRDAVANALPPLEGRRPQE